MPINQRHILIVAGETSGDIHAAHLVTELKKINPTFSFSGLGGPRLEAAGVEIYKDLTKLAVVGFTEVIKHYHEFKQAFDLILNKITETQAEAIILVDYPGFNLRLAKAINKKIKVIYYISPQVWAWKKNRVFLIKKYIDKMMVIFPFEKDFYARYGIYARFVGHPLTESIRISRHRDHILQQHNLNPDQTTIGLLPGSRHKEIDRHLPIMLKTAEILQKKFPMLQFLLIKAPNMTEDILSRYLLGTILNIHSFQDDSYELRSTCHLCLVASGTATLETALLNVPMVVIYKTSFLTWLLAKLFIKIPYIALVNVVAKKKIVPEFVQYQAKPRIIAKQCEQIFSDDEATETMKKSLDWICSLLGKKEASQQAAQEVVNTIG
ncbi:MAG: lipid-A-disaccharide synthase [Candidatus Omnitrophica bacterium]|nr:lipid-A-disaccharide synthase [Candidatus Omnitrophota bacterium]